MLELTAHYKQLLGRQLDAFTLDKNKLFIVFSKVKIFINGLTIKYQFNF